MQKRVWESFAKALPTSACPFCRCRVESKRGTIRNEMRYWEIIADNLSKAGFGVGTVQMRLIRLAA
jgi:hypothetical protein